MKTTTSKITLNTTCNVTTDVSYISETSFIGVTNTSGTLVFTSLPSKSAYFQSSFYSVSNNAAIPSTYNSTITQGKITVNNSLRSVSYSTSIYKINGITISYRTDYGTYSFQAGSWYTTTTGQTIINGSTKPLYRLQFVSITSYDRGTNYGASRLKTWADSGVIVTSTFAKKSLTTTSNIEYEIECVTQI